MANTQNINFLTVPNIKDFTIDKKFQIDLNQFSKSNEPVVNQYVVQNGDYLSSIAKKINVPLNQILEENNISNPNLIHTGQVIKYTQTPEQPKTRLWQDVQNYESRLNSTFGQDYKGLINQFYKDKNNNQLYLIDDKKNNTLGIYKNGKLIRQFSVIHGANGQQQNWNSNQKHLYRGAQLEDADNYTITLTTNGRINDGAGNLSTPAGSFYISPAGNYHNLPAWTRYSVKGNPKNSKGVNYSEIPSSMHFRNVMPGKFSNGCTGISAHDLQIMKSILGNQKDIPIYILPHDTTKNKFFVRNGEINFSSTIQPHDYTTTKGRVVSTSPQLNGVKTGYRSDFHLIFGGPGMSSSDYSQQQINVAQQFANSLSVNKKRLMEDLANTPYVNADGTKTTLAINDDTYNNLALAAVGILGRESSYGKKESEITNWSKGFGKATGLSQTSPDIYRKYKGYPFYDGAKNDNNSIGLTQIRLNNLTDYEKQLFTKYQITKKDLVYNPNKAAIATLIHLAQVYRDAGLNIDKAIGMWNTRNGYTKSVKDLYNKDFIATVTYNKYGGKLIKKYFI